MRARWLVVAAGVMVGLVGLGGSVSASPAPSINGSGTITLPAEYGDFAGDPVIFQLQAQGGVSASGRFNVVHLDDAGGLYAHVVGDVTCVSVSEGIAVTTGIIRHAWFRDFPGSQVVDMAVAITVADRGRSDALAFDFEFFGSDIAPCGAISRFIPIDRGNFTVR